MASLLLCAGTEIFSEFSDWTTLDGNPDVGAKITQVVPPIPAGPWDNIALIHGIEHFYEWEAPVLLRECYEALVPGGKLILEQPDIKVCARVLLGAEHPHENFGGQFDICGFFGDPRYKEPLMVHKWGWWPESLEAACRTAGFSSVAHCPVRYHAPFRDFRVEATK